MTPSAEAQSVREFLNACLALGVIKLPYPTRQGVEDPTGILARQP
jgi:hypothetical protein